MSSQPKITNSLITSSELLKAEMGKRLQDAAGQALKNKLETGEVKILNGRYVFHSGLKVKRAVNLRSKYK